jgi:hypothetical protein
MTEDPTEAHMKNEEIRLDRREFSLAAALAVLSGVSITISACGGGSSSPTTPTPTPTPSSGDKVGVISANHGHSGAVITAARLASPDVVDLDITGSAGHPHHVLLSAAQVTQIAANTRVTQTSTTDSGHSHDVTFN